jgi:multiple sugar transport system permease protein
MTAIPLAKASTASARGRKTTRAYDWRVRYFNWFCMSVLVVFGAIWVIPLLFALDTSLKPDSAITLDPTTWWSSSWTLSAYRQVTSFTDIASWYLNSFIIATLSAIFAVVACSMAGFAIARTQFVARRIVYGLIAVGLLIPSQVLIVPMFAEFNFAHLLNTYWVQVLPAISVPIAVFIFVAFFNGIPGSLAESARVDGASWWHIYRRIYLPLTRPAISAVFIFTFVWKWNDFLWPLLTLTNTKTMTLPVGLSQVSSGYGIQYAEQMASAVLGALPLIVVFLLFQRRIVEGIATSGIK